MDYHTLSREEILDNLDTDASGLSSEEANEREKRYGLNILPTEPEPTVLEHFVRQFKSPIIYVLLAAILLSLIIKEYTDAGFILLVLFLNAMIGTYQEYTSSQKARHLQNLIQTRASVLRDGQLHEIESSHIVPGDILLFEPGTKVSCDIRLLSSNHLLVDESLLTGESVDIYKDAEFLSDDASLIVAERKNMLFAGTFISSGRGRGVAAATGAYTQTGKIAALLSKKRQARIPLLEKMEKLTFTISLFIGITVVSLFVFGLLKGVDLYTLFLFSVALAVSTIPEGLPVAITVALTSASLAMSKRNVIVRKLAAIEGLGACTLIASDKTGTLTQNRLSVEYFISPTQVYDTDIMGDAQEMVYLASILCNEMHYEEAKEGKVEFFGDQVDIALARFAADADESYITAAKAYRKIDEIPYEPVNKFSAVMIELEGEIIQFSKGSPETVLAHCKNSDEEKNRILESVDEWAMRGYRTIALAYKESEEEETITLNNFTYLGFVAIIDPVRDEAPEAVKKAQNAGIKVVMITGDHPNTALSIAKELGIAKSHYDVMNDKALREWEENGAKVEEIKEKSIFSRVTPSQKMKIVQAFQELGHYVAVTGDGVNDSPALRHANIGIAMGKSGTDIAKSSSDLIITDDNFSSIVDGIEEGRRAHDNIRKVIYLLISTGFAELILVMLSFLTGLPLPLLPVQLLWLNLVTNGIEDVMLGLEKAEPGLLSRPPRSPKEPLFNSLMLRRIVVGGFYIGITSFLLFYLLLEDGMKEESARNIVLLLVVLFENVHVFNARTETNFLHQIGYKNSLFLIYWVLFTQLLHLASMHIPFMQELLSIEPVSLEIWAMLFTLALGLVLVMEADKWVQLRKGTLQRREV
ncbi:cation-translocating P-type ATPase [Sulfurovum mangrovi]|uniref:cation-translocating P-type ATPase n=1 Tax=Sulfurovum mangrovi TaxID=2893889 RepID=UPI001E3AF5D7|nr:cation-transporting P-type ATPase [Sulfurovum mangrovi]UFH60391.1 cation-transporting P-type ATPase [Sulfurovum mangrovi]